MINALGLVVDVEEGGYSRGKTLEEMEVAPAG